MSETKGPPYEPTPGQMIRRGLARRCPRCGASGVFASRMKLKEFCPSCELKLEREDAHFVGAMAMNLVVAEILFAVMLVSWIAASWPDPPWLWITIAGVSLNAIIPLLLYPMSKTLWTAIDLLMHRFDPIDRTEIEL